MKTRMMMACCIGLLLLLIVVPAVTHAEVPKQINYQGILADSNGNPVSDGDYEMSFAIYNSPTGVTELWSEDQTVTVTNGIYNVILGQPGNLLDPDDFDGDLYLGVTVGTDAEMTPRQKITATAFTLKAAKAEDADTLDGKDSVALDQSAHVTRTDNPHSVTAAQTGAATLSDITWGNLSNIPAGFADGEDDTGILTETDPTILDPSIKDGVSWGELSSIPPGFADGVDNDSGGDITGVTAGTGLSGGGTSGTVTLDVDIPFSLTGSVLGGLIYASNTFWAGTGLRGSASGTDGVGVSGRASSSYGTNYGGWFEAGGDSGRGVYALAENVDPTITNYGGYFEAWGGSGYGVYGVSRGETGVGVYGEATDTAGGGSNYGGYFTSAGPNGFGVYGETTSGWGTGVYGHASGSTTSNSTGVLGEALDGLGVLGRALGTSGTGVHGEGGDYDFYAAGPGTNYGYASSIRWKQNIREIEGALEMVLKMRGVYFDWDEEHGGYHDLGFIAEEVGKYVPEAVGYEQDSEFATGMDYGMITPILLQAIKEQHVII